MGLKERVLDLQKGHSSSFSAGMRGEQSSGNDNCSSESRTSIPVEWSNDDSSRCFFGESLTVHVNGQSICLQLPEAALSRVPLLNPCIASANCFFICGNADPSSNPRCSAARRKAGSPSSFRQAIMPPQTAHANRQLPSAQRDSKRLTQLPCVFTAFFKLSRPASSDDMRLHTPSKLDKLPKVATGTRHERMSIDADGEFDRLPAEPDGCAEWQPACSPNGCSRCNSRVKPWLRSLRAAPDLVHGRVGHLSCG